MSDSTDTEAWAEGWHKGVAYEKERANAPETEESWRSLATARDRQLRESRRATAALIAEMGDILSVETRASLSLRSASRIVGPTDIPARPEPRGKNLVDMLLAVSLIACLLPVFIAVAVAIRVTSRGPVFFIQDRIGRNGELFPFIKFRTMVDGAHKQRSATIGDPDEEIADRYRCDPRVTSVGKFLRRSSIDELPQLFNVLFGQMSIVGPRPMLEEESHLLQPRHHVRHLAKPGLTGLWQISGRKKTTWDERMALDAQYVSECSVSRDLSIMARTVKVVVSGDGAY